MSIEKKSFKSSNEQEVIELESFCWRGLCHKKGDKVTVTLNVYEEGGASHVCTVEDRTCLPGCVHYPGTYKQEKYGGTVSKITEHPASSRDLGFTIVTIDGEDGTQKKFRLDNSVFFERR